MSSARLLLSALAVASLPLTLGAQDNDPPGRAGRISSVLGTVSFQAAGTNDWSLAPLNYTVTSGDRVLTSQRGRAEVEVGPYDIRLADSTDLSIVYLTDDFTQLGLNQGTMRVSVYRLARGDSLEIDTPNGALIVRSAGRYRVDVLSGVSTIVTVEDGAMEVSGPGLDQMVRRGQSVELTGANPVRATFAERPRVTAFDQWSADRDRRQEMSDCSRYVSRDIPGCADLSDHGHWTQHHEYGPVWRPRLVSVGWVPYRHGRWVWSGPWGWTWVENTPWGFAPFHYGRWVTVGGVWVWAPGPIVRRPYYAPALVVFVGGPHYGRQHQAWFPLGWREPYYPRYRHSDRYRRYVNITNVRNVTNVDEFVDPRRADRIRYSNRQATTVAQTEVFGRRQVVHQASNVRPDEIERAPIARERWDGPTRVATRGAAPETHDRDSPDRSAVIGSRRQTVIPSADGQPARIEDSRTVIPRRDAQVREVPRGAAPEETRPRVAAPEEIRPRVAAPEEARPRERSSSLIFRNAPPTERRRSAEPSPAGEPTNGEIARRRPAEVQPTPDSPVDRRPTITRRSDPAERPLPSSIRRGDPVERPSAASPTDGQLRRGELDRSRPSGESRAPQRTSAPQRETAPRQSAPRQSAPRGPGASAAPRSQPKIASRRPGGNGSP